MTQRYETICTIRNISELFSTTTIKDTLLLLYSNNPVITNEAGQLLPYPCFKCFVRSLIHPLINFYRYYQFRGSLISFSLDTLFSTTSLIFMTSSLQERLQSSSLIILSFRCSFDSPYKNNKKAAMIGVNIMAMNTQKALSRPLLSVDAQ